MSTVIRVKKRHRYVSLDQRLVEDERLPWAARGVLVYLLAKPDDWTIRVEDLRRRGDLGRDAIYKVFEVLRRYGYLQREQQRDARGRLAKTLYTVFEIPVASPLPEAPDTADPCPVKPTRPNNQRTQEPIKQITTTTTTEDKVPTEPNGIRGGGGGDDDIDFEYPPGLSTAEITEAKKKLRGLGRDVAQQLLDELAGRMAVNAIRGAPLAYLRGLVNRAVAGDYSPEAALAIEAKRNPPVSG